SDLVVNLVGILAGDFQRIQVEGARIVAEAAKTAGVTHLVHISAIGADPASPSAYGRSKGEGEAAVRAAFPGATILRPSIVFGREDQFINRFAKMVASAPI
ncbi:sugar nucleotide-binding protein, partial [Pseudomonas sp. GP01-A4]|uniref:sugar nucleotide-binding protein n=2 Tax=Pseudomonadota TaxID=1224 RepID=UPI000CC33B6F